MGVVSERELMIANKRKRVAGFMASLSDRIKKRCLVDKNSGVPYYFTRKDHLSANDIFRYLFSVNDRFVCYFCFIFARWVVYSGMAVRREVALFYDLVSIYCLSILLFFGVFMSTQQSLSSSSLTPTPERKFLSGFRWNLCGSVVYEVFKAVHCALLWHYLDPVTYGKVGSIFSVVYLAIRFSDFGFAYSLPPFLPEAIKSKRHFFYFIFYYSLLPALFPISLMALLFTWWYQAYFTPPYTFVLPVLIVLETMRAFLRMFLHVASKSNVIVVVELFIFFIYIAFIWVAHFCYAQPLTLDLVFLPHLFDSVVCLLLFFIVLFFYYKRLPAYQVATENNVISGSILFSPGFLRRLYASRFFNYLLRINRNLFTSNFLTPLFALLYSIESAGIFYLASTLANAVTALVRSIVTFAGGSLFSQVKGAPLQEKRDAFALVSRKVSLVLFWILFFLMLGFPLFSGHVSFWQIFFCSLLYFFIMIADFIFLIYEQFYLLEERQARLFSLKFFELTIFWALFKVKELMSLELLLGVILLSRILTLVVTALDAYTKWRLVPALFSFKIEFRRLKRNKRR